jgi:DNA-binding FadR family transcriptional regulator
VSATTDGTLQNALAPRAGGGPGRGRRGLHGQVVEVLGAMIARGDFDHATPLVPDEIGERLGVSRTVVREALRVLEAKGMVAARQYVGTLVQPTEHWNLLDPDVIAWRIRGPERRDQMRELLELRAAVEPHAARLAAERASPAQVERLERAQAAMAQAAVDQRVDDFTAADIDFHAALLEASGNRPLVLLNGAIRAALLARGVLFATADDLAPEAITLHARLADAVRRRRPERAERVMRAILDEATHDIDQVLPRLDSLPALETL